MPPEWVQGLEKEAEGLKKGPKGHKKLTARATLLGAMNQNILVSKNKHESHFIFPSSLLGGWVMVQAQNSAQIHFTKSQLWLGLSFDNILLFFRV